MLAKCSTTELNTPWLFILLNCQAGPELPMLLPHPQETVGVYANHSKLLVQGEGQSTSGPLVSAADSDLPKEGGSIFI